MQAPYLTQAFQGASNALGTASGATIPQNFTAQYTPAQLDQFQKMIDYSNGSANIPNSSASAGGVASGAGANGILNGVNGLQSFTPTGGIQADANGGNTYASNVNIGALTKAAMQSANDEAQFVTNPGIDRAAAGSGNINSSRDAIAHGLVARGLTQDAANTAATLAGNAYNTGAGLTEQGNEAANANRLAALNSSIAGGAVGLNAGTGANTGAVNDAGGLYNLAQTGVSGQLAGAQAGLTNEQQKFTANTNDPFAALQNFYNIIGANNWGNSTSGTSTGTSVQTNKPSTLSQIGGWTNFVGSLL